MKVKCKIGYLDNTSAWIEELDAESMKTAKEDIQAIIDRFNQTLRPFEKPRKLIEIIKKPRLKLNKKHLEIWYIEPDDYEMDYLKQYMTGEQLNKINVIHKRKMTNEEGTPDIIFIDTSAINPAASTGFNGISLTYQLIDFVKRHKSSLIFICSYVRRWAEEYLEELKEELSTEDLFIKICDNGYTSIADEIKKVLK